MNGKKQWYKKYDMYQFCNQKVPESSIIMISERYYEKQVFYKKSCIKHFAIFTGKHLCWSIFLIKFIKKKFQHIGFSHEYCKIFKSIFREIKRFSILQKICERLFERFSTGTNNIIVTSHIHRKWVRRFRKKKPF